MAFHVRLQRQIIFTEETYNLNEAELMRRFVDPWLAGKPIIIKGRTWVPERSRISILEGPDLTSTQRSWVQGWTKALELSENVTDRFLHSPPVAVEKARSTVPIAAEPESGAREAEPGADEPTDLAPAASGAGAADGSWRRPDKPWYRTVFDVSTARGAVASAVVGGLIVLLLAPLVTSLPSLPYEGARSLYFFFAASAKEKFDLESDVSHRPIWLKAPTLYGKSLSYAVGANGGSSDDGQVAETNHLVVEHHSISELVEKAVEFNGIPTEFVGRVQSDMAISPEEDQGPLTTEYVLTGSKLGAIAFLGISYVETGGISLSVGETVVVRGVVVASGVARELGGPERDAVYVMGLSSASVEAAEESESLKTLSKEASESG
jgi:hypothetical protein